MLRTAFTAAVALALLAGPAAASSCPRQMAAIDAALAKNPPVPEARLNEAKKLRALGEQLHKEGKHADSVATLTLAERMLGIGK
jgi:hypothetical protein